MTEEELEKEAELIEGLGKVSDLVVVTLGYCIGANTDESMRAAGMLRLIDEILSDVMEKAEAL